MPCKNLEHPRKCKKYASYDELLQARHTEAIIKRGATALPYRDTDERLATLLARNRVSKKMTTC